MKYSNLEKLAYSLAVVLDTWHSDPDLFDADEAKEFSEDLYAELHASTGLEDLTPLGDD